MAVTPIDYQLYPGSAAAGSLAIPLNDGTPAVGQHCIVGAMYRGGSGNTPTTPSGWTLVTAANTDSTVVGLVAYEKFLVSGDITGASVTIAFSQSTNLLCGFRTLASGVDTTDAIVAAAATNTGGTASTTATAPSVDPGGVTGCHLIVAYAINGTNTGTIPPPTGMTARGKVSTTAATANVTGALFDQALSAGTATGTRTTTQSSTAQRSVGLSVLLRPAATGGSTPITHAPAQGAGQGITTLSETGVNFLFTDDTVSYIADDWLFAVATIRNNPGRTFNTVTAWTKPVDATDTDSQIRCAAWTRHMTGSGTTDFAVTPSGTGSVNSTVLYLMRIRGLNTTTGLAAAALPTVSSPAGDSVTISHTNTIATVARVYWIVASRNRHFVAAAAWSPIFENVIATGGVNSGEWVSLSLYYLDVINAGSVVSGSGTFYNPGNLAATQSADWVSHMLVATPLSTGTGGGGGGGSTGALVTTTPTQAPIVVRSASVPATDVITWFNTYNKNLRQGPMTWRKAAFAPITGTHRYQRGTLREWTTYVGPAGGSRSTAANYAYDWSRIDDEIRLAQLNGEYVKLGIRFMSGGVDLGAYTAAEISSGAYKSDEKYTGMPEWYMRQGHGKEERRTTLAGTNNALWWNDWNEQLFADTVKAFLVAFVARYQNEPVLDEIEWSPYGKFGENAITAGGIAADSDQRVYDMFDWGFEYLAAYFNISFMAGGDAKWRNYVRTTYMDDTPHPAMRGFNLHSGGDDPFDGPATDLDSVQAYKKGKMHMELIGTTGHIDDAAFRTKMVTQVQTHHVLSVGNANASRPAGRSDWADWTMEEQRDWLKAMTFSGYRYTVVQARIPGTISRSDAFPIELSWANLGVAVTVDDFTIVHQLRTATNGGIVWESSSSLNLRDVLPNALDMPQVHTDTKILPPTVPNGTYVYGVVVQPNGTTYQTDGQMLRMQLSGTNARSTDGTGFYPLNTTVAVSGEVAAQAPAAPTSLGQSGVSGARVLTWTDNATNEANYYVGVNPDPTDPDGYDELFVLPANTTAFTYATPVNTGDTVTFEVFTRNPFGDSAKLTGTYTNSTEEAQVTSVVAVWFEGDPPITPFPATDDYIQLTITPFPLSVRVERREGTGPWEQRLNARTNTAGQVFDLLGIDPPVTTLYRYRVQTARPDGIWIESNDVTAFGASDAPDPPSDLHQIGRSATSVTVAWTPPARALEAGYLDEYGFQIASNLVTPSWSTASTNGYIGPAASSVEIAGLTANTTYRVRMRSFRTAGSAASAWIETTVSTAVAAPGVAAVIDSVTVYGPTLVYLAWHPAAAADPSWDTRIDLATTLSPTSTDWLAYEPGKKNTLAGNRFLTGLIPNQAYSVRVYYVGPGGRGPTTGVATFITPAFTKRLLILDGPTHSLDLYQTTPNLITGTARALSYIPVSDSTAETVQETFDIEIKAATGNVRQGIKATLERILNTCGTGGGVWLTERVEDTNDQWRSEIVSGSVRDTAGRNRWQIDASCTIVTVTWTRRNWYERIAAQTVTLTGGSAGVTATGGIVRNSPYETGFAAPANALIVPILGLIGTLPAPASVRIVHNSAGGTPRVTGMILGMGLGGFQSVQLGLMAANPRGIGSGVTLQTVAQPTCAYGYQAIYTYSSFARGLVAEWPLDMWLSVATPQAYRIVIHPTAWTSFAGAKLSAAIGYLNGPDIVTTNDVLADARGLVTLGVVYLPPGTTAGGGASMLAPLTLRLYAWSGSGRLDFDYIQLIPMGAGMREYRLLAGARGMADGDILIDDMPTSTLLVERPNNAGREATYLGIGQIEIQPQTVQTLILAALTEWGVAGPGDDMSWINHQFTITLSYRPRRRTL